jgi:hypothetical protein
MTPQAREDGLLVQEVGDEIVVYDRKQDRIHALNLSAALIWRHCDGQTSITEMATLLGQKLGLPADQDLVWLALVQLRKAHLLQEALPQMIEERVKLSRREMIRRLELAGVLSLLLPGVTSILTPLPAMAQGYGGEDTCTGTADTGCSGTCTGAHLTCRPHAPTGNCFCLPG